MLRILIIAFISLSLHAFSYPQPYKELAGPLFKARVQLDDLAYNPKFRPYILSYVAHSDHVLGHFKRIKVDSDPTQLQAYHKALLSLQDEYNTLALFLYKQLSGVISKNQYPIFLKIASTLSDEEYNNPYVREKVYTYYHAHRHEEPSCLLDTRIKNEWDTLASYYPTKALFDYETTDNAYYREVIVITTAYSPYGAKVEAFLKKNNVKYKKYDLTKDEEGTQLFKKHKGTRIPMVIINNRVVEGYNEYEMDKLLRH